ncbi:cytochrome P450 monooxygenase [Fusarium globosum]|uniref:Cytochrome P450 monooxygenase n=1 Tax=Fusarium globosum TaxID=78864 RepID=A0A8H6CZY4_9HYPO|nr:cytochrome P450 monooxygenase [Fusarium globosum]
MFHIFDNNSSIERTKLFQYAVIFFVSFKLITYLQRLFFHPLSKFPGPRICAASRLYEFYWDSYQHGRLWAKLPDLHRRYGPIVRIGPNEVHIEDSEYFDTIFGFRPLNKEAMTAKEFGINHALFGVEDYKTYVKKRAAFGNAFSRTKLSKIQDQINEEIQKGCTWVEDNSKDGSPVDLAFLFRAVPAEIITKYLFGQEYGFLQHVQTTKNLYDKRMDRLLGFSHLGRFIPKEIPLFLSLFRQLILRALGFNDPGSAFLDYFLLAQKLVQKVVAQHNHPNHNAESITEHTVFDDFLDSSLPQEEKEKGPLTQQAVAIWSGGWDTVGFVLTMAAYQLLQNPPVEQRLYQELKEAWKDPTESPEITTLEGLPYLTAVVKETFRLSPGALCRLSRVNPSGIEQYGDWEIPPGTIISMSIPDVLSDKAIWGSDAAVFNPERWLSGGADLDRYLVTFSKGTRVCPGIELAWIETRLVIASLFRRYEMSITPEAGISDDDIMPYYEGFTPAVKNWISRMPVRVKPRH